MRSFSTANAAEAATSQAAGCGQEEEEEKERLAQLHKATARQRGHLLPRVVRFGLSPSQALERFEAWQAEHWLSPSQLTGGGLRSTAVSARLLPFWLFESKVAVRYTGKVGVAEGDAGDRPGVGIRWQQQPWREVPMRTYPWTRLSMQVYASYKYRRDLARAAQFEGALSRSRPLTLPTVLDALALRGSGGGDAGTRTVRGVALPSRAVLDPPDLKQAIAWEFALAAIREHETALAAEQLRRQAGAGPDAAVREVEVELRVLRRRARLLYLPAYVLDYEWGEAHNEAGEKGPQSFQALVGGAPDAAVAGERHFCPLKAQLTAASALGITGMAATALAAPFVGLDLGALLSIEWAFWTFLVAVTAGISARTAPQLLRRSEESKRIAAEAAEFERIAAVGLGPLDVGDERQEALRSAGEWRRWEQSEAWRWDEGRRRAWAERLWREQQRRRLERTRFVERLRLDAERQRMEVEREAKRREKYGHSSFSGHGHANGFAGGQRGGGRSDWLGYYKVLGLEAGAAAPAAGAGGGIDEAAVKAAFRRAAMRWHPDRLKDANDAARKAAAERFQQITDAYNVLRDPELRRQYDAGQLHH